MFLFEPIKKKTELKHVFNLSIKRLKLVASPAVKKVKKLKLTSEQISVEERPSSKIRAYSRSNSHNEFKGLFPA